MYYSFTYITCKILNCYTFYKNRYIFAFQHLPDQIDIVQGKMMGIEKDGIILKSKWRKKNIWNSKWIRDKHPNVKISDSNSSEHGCG